MSKFTDHLKKYKWVYISAGVIVFAGTTTLIMRESSRTVLGYAGSGCPEKGSAEVLSYFNKIRAGGDINITTNLHYGTRGHPGFLTLCKETGTVFETQGAAARALDIPESVMSRHLNGILPDAKGFHFERICMAA